MPDADFVDDLHLGQADAHRLTPVVLDAANTLPPPVMPRWWPTIRDADG
jgi:hypothetical protein